MLHVSLAGDALTLEEPSGLFVDLTRVNGIPVAADCAPLVEVARHGGLPRPASKTDLVRLGSRMAYTSLRDSVESFDLTTAALASPFAPANGSMLQVATVKALPRTFWLVDPRGALRCLIEATVSRDAPQVNLDYFCTQDLGVTSGVDILAAARDPGTGRFWMHGDRGRPSDRTHYFLGVETVGSGYEFLREDVFDRAMDGLAHDGTDLWGLIRTTTQSIVRMSAPPFVDASYEVPDGVEEWVGIHADADALWLLGDDGSAGVLVRLERPT